jgi:hypothetical protein
MSDLGIEVVGVTVEPYAAVPTLAVKLHLSSTVPVHALVLRVQVRIEPQRRTYTPAEEDRLLELFGETPQWGESLRPFLWTHLETSLQGFTGSTMADVPMVCSYDFDVAAAKYLHGLDGGEVPLVFLFSGTVFAKGPDGGFAVQLVPWHLESRYGLPVAVWRELMDRYFPGGGWLRLSRDTIDGLQRFKAEEGFATYEQALEALLKDGDPRPGGREREMRP